MTKKSSIKQTIEQIDLLLDKQQFEQAFELLNQLNVSEIGSTSEEAGHLLYFTAVSFYKKSEYKQALSKAEEAFDILKNSNENRRIGQIQILLGDIYLNLGKNDKSEIEYRDALAIFRRIEDSKKTVHLYNKLARICFIRCDFEAAIEYLKNGIKQARELNDIGSISRLTINLGTVYRFLGKWNLGEETHLLALDVVKRANSKLDFSRLIFTLGYLVFLQRRFSEAEDYYKEGYKLVTEAGDVYESSTFYEYQGELCFVQGDWHKARELYNKALEIGEKIAPEGDIINQTCRLLAELELTEGNLDKAFSFCERSLKVSLKLKDRFEEGIIYKILAQIYFRKKDTQKAKEYFQKSIRLLKQIKAIYELGRSYLEAGKSDCFNYLERLKFLGNAQDLFGEVDTKYHIAHTHLAISKLLYQNNEFNKAFSFIQEAEGIFKKMGEKKDLKKVLNFKFEIERMVSQSEQQEEAPSNFPFSSFITQDTEMLNIIHIAQQVKDKDVTILLQGETGVGKDLLAKIIHYNSNRKDKRFVAINCANLPETLLESELFGHRRGSFTGATQDKKGLLEAIDGGTLFLNEIGELPLSIQSKLLTVLEEKEFTRLGDVNSMKVNIRIIAATNRDLQQAVESKAFREDLYYRLSVIRLNLPPLRERREDIKPLVALFLEKHADGSRDKVLEASNRLADLYMNYDWPGNVRELENEIIKLSTLIEMNDQNRMNKLIKQIQREKQLKSGHSLLNKKEKLEKVEIINALKLCNNIKLRAAKMLNIPESTLRRRIRKLDVTA